MHDTVSLAELGIEEDPGCSWHPRPDKTEARDANGNLRDLTDEECAEHACKPEAADQLDAAEPLAAEDSIYSAAGQV